MSEVMEDPRIGSVNLFPGSPFGMEAKLRIAELLGIKINSVEKFRGKLGLEVIQAGSDNP
jgi:hypothetical protein